VAGTHCARDLMQFEQGCLRSHFILRCWHSIHASTRCGFESWAGESATGDLSGVVQSTVGSAIDIIGRGGVAEHLMRRGE
jgi:hypothetical protein